MVTCLLDTAILIDLIRKYPPAEAWIATQSSPGVCTVVWLEVLQGAANRADQQKALKLLSSLERIDVIPTDFEWAIASLLTHALSHRVGALDCLIAAGTVVWLVYPETKEVEIYRPGQPVQTVGADGTLDSSEVLPGFTLAVKDIFTV